MGDERTDETFIITEMPAHAPPTPVRRAYVVVVAGHGMGEVFALDRTLTVGRGDDADVRVPDTGISRRHARFVVTGDHVIVEDLGSTNGTFVNGRRVSGQSILADGDRLQFGTLTVLRFEARGEADEAFQRRMFESASRDALTGTLNTRYFVERLDAEVAHASRHGAHLSLLLFDIDAFKAVNDTYGHPAGDRVLCGVAAVAAATVQPDGVLGRYGGDEFAVIVRSAGASAAVELTKRLREAIATEPFDANETTVSVTVSVGVASIGPARTLTGAALIALADEALYRAKRGGRNRVEVDGIP